MPRYVIERQYLLPVYEQLLIEAPNLDAACREALDETAHPWGRDAKEDFDNARPVTITEAVELPEAQVGQEAEHTGLGYLLYHSGLDPLPIPAEFAEGAADDPEVMGFS
jgi:hypothetical protein